jgi:hypothetical protein
VALLRYLGHLWSLPNTLVGLLFGIGGRYVWQAEHRVFFVQGGWMVRIFSSFGFAGMCVGDVVLFRHPLPEWILRHELVHAVQARILGVLYLPLTVLGYALGVFLCPKNPHDGSPLEIWADTASGNRDKNTFLRGRR